MERVDIRLSELSLPQKLDLMEALWENLSGDDQALESPGWHEEILEDREKALASGVAEVSDWEQARERIRRNISCK